MDQLIELSTKFLAHIPVEGAAITLIYLIGIFLVMLWCRLSILPESLLATVRAFIQLIMLGGVLLFFFRVDNMLLNIALCGLMVLVAGLTAAVQSPQDGAVPVSLISQGIAITITITPMTLLGVIDLRASFFLPITAMIIRNTLDRASLAFERLDSEMRQNRDLVEQYLALGIDPARASQDIARKSIESSLIPTLNKLDVVGLVGLPGLMTGIIISAKPDQLIEKIAYGATLQAIVLYMIFGASVLSSVILTHWMKHTYFNQREQLQFHGD